MSQQPVLAPETYLEGRPQDMRLRLNTPQMNRLKYLVGCELGDYVPSSKCPWYEGGEPYLIVSDAPLLQHSLPIEVDGKTRYVLRSASQDELDGLLDLKAQLDNLWAGGERVTGEWHLRNVESV